MGLDVAIPLLVMAICLIPNLLLIWGVNKLQIGKRLGDLSPILLVISLLATYVSYIPLRDDLIIFSLLMAIVGAIAALVAIDYFITKKGPITMVIGVLAYFFVLVFCETVIIGIIGHM